MQISSVFSVFFARFAALMVPLNPLEICTEMIGLSFSRIGLYTSIKSWADGWDVFGKVSLFAKSS
jgi:hypothetical protein